MKILLTGSSGFIGSHVKKVFANQNLFLANSKSYNLLDFTQAAKMFVDSQPDIVIHLAAKSGGILANRDHCAEFWYQNMAITTHIWELSKRHAIKKLIYIMPGCAYPKNANSPIVEEDLFNGFPDLHPAPGAMAKKMGILASYAYKQQYGLNSCVLIPCNLYGEYDQFDEINSHVIPAMIMKMDKAKKNRNETITLWGGGNAVRDFAHAEDLANLIPFFIENNLHFENTPVYLNNVCNLSSGVPCTIKELAETIADVVGYTGKIIWDTSKPEGPSNKVFDNSRMKSLGLSFKITLREGLVRTYEWYNQSVS